METLHSYHFVKSTLFQSPFVKFSLATWHYDNIPVLSAQRGHLNHVMIIKIENGIYSNLHSLSLMNGEILFSIS